MFHVKHILFPNSLGNKKTPVLRSFSGLIVLVGHSEFISESVEIENKDAETSSA